MAAEIICPDVFNLVPYTVYSDSIRIGVLAEYAARSGYISSVEFSVRDENNAVTTGICNYRTAYVPSAWDGGRDDGEYVFDLNATIPIDTLADGWLRVSGLVTTSDGKTRQTSEYLYYNNSANSLNGQTGTIYVDSTLGNDANTGSFAEPVETIARGLALAKEFDVLKLADGEYYWANFTAHPPRGTGWITLESYDSNSTAIITGNGSTNDGPGGTNGHKHYCLGTGIELNEARVTILGGDVDGEWWLNGIQCYNNTVAGGPLSLPNLGLNPARYFKWYQTNTTWHTLFEPNTAPSLSRGSKCHNMASDSFLKTSRAKNCLYYNTRLWDTIQEGGAHGDIMQFNENVAGDTSEQIAVQGVRSNDTEFQFLITSNTDYAVVSGFLLENVLHDNTGISAANIGEGNVTNTFVVAPIDNWIWRNVTLLSQSLAIDPTVVEGDWEILNSIFGNINPEAGSNQAQLLANQYIYFDSVIYRGTNFTDLPGQNLLTGTPTFTNQDYSSQDPHILDYTLTGGSLGKGQGTRFSGMPNSGWVGPDVDVGAWFNVTTNNFTFYSQQEVNSVNVGSSDGRLTVPEATVEDNVNLTYNAVVSRGGLEVPFVQVVTDSVAWGPVVGSINAPSIEVVTTQVPTLVTADLRGSVPSPTLNIVYDGSYTGVTTDGRLSSNSVRVATTTSDPVLEVDPLKNTEYTLGWSIRVKPFKSRTRWVDWEGYNIYKNEIVPELEAKGWVKPAFYTQYSIDDISLAKAETPIYMVVYGHLSGDADDVVTANNYLQSFYQTLTTPNVAYTPHFVNHVQSVTLNNTTVTGTNPEDPKSHYWGWEPWTNNGTGQNTGPTGFLSPDFTSVNSTFNLSYPAIEATGCSVFNYLSFSFVISTGSEWTKSLSGYDLVSKSLGNSLITYDGTQYHEWANSPTAYIDAHEACFTIPENLAKFTGIAGVLQSVDAGAYHDTFGLWGKGCYSKTHHIRTGTTGEVRSHARGSFTHYYNKQQANWLENWLVIQSGNVFKQAAEYPGDINLQYATNYLSREPIGPIVSAYYSLSGSLRADFNKSSLYNATYVKGTVEPPHWLEKCPAFNIVYGDRSIACNWSIPDIGNGMNISGAAFTLGPVTGYMLGATLHADQTHEHREQDWACWAGLSWQALGRITFSYQSLDYEYINTDWSVVSEDIAESLFETEWSGYAANYISRFLRIQAYEPDYLYHGTLQHMLSDWEATRSTDNTITRGARFARTPQLEDPDYTGFGEDTILHSVRKHRDKNNFLVTMFNWHTGEHGFTGVFNPADYGIVGAYRVYTLDVTGDNHGTKTFQAILDNNEKYLIDISLEKYGFHVLEVQSIQTTVDPQFRGLTVDNTRIVYGYSNTTLSVDSLTLAYNYASECAASVEAAFEGFKAPSTQAIANNLPPWMLVRQDQDSTGWKLINSWGHNLEGLLQNTADRIVDLKLITADPTCKNSTYFFDIDIQELTQPREFRNLLFNSSFAIPDVARTNAPAGWFTKDNTKLVNTSLEGSKSVLCTHKATLKQTQDLDNQLIDTLTASVYVLSDTEEVDVTLSISAETIDATTLTQEGSITSRSKQWKRLVVSLPINKQVYSVNFVIKVVTNGTALVCAPMLELGSMVTKWTRSELDVLSYVSGASRLGLINSISDNGDKIPIFPVAREEDFLYIRIPTRIRKLPNPLVKNTLYSSKSFGRKVTYFNEVLMTEWAVVEGQIVERGRTTTVWDIYGRYDIRDVRYFDNLELGTIHDCSVNIVPLACAISGSWLFVVCEEHYQGKIFYTLKLVRPVVPPNGQTYLESVTDFKLDLDMNTKFGFNQVDQETVTSIAFSEENINSLVINTSANKSHYFELYYDYYYYKTNSNRVYTLEGYEGSQIQVT